MLLYTFEISQKSMEKTQDNLERQIDLLGQGLNNLREIVQLLRMKREEEKKPTVKAEEEEGLGQRGD